MHRREFSQRGCVSHAKRYGNQWPIGMFIMSTTIGLVGIGANRELLHAPWKMRIMPNPFFYSVCTR